MRVVATAPVRVDLTGGYTDVFPYTAARAGVTVNAAVRRFATAAVTARTDGRCRVLHDNRLVSDVTRSALRDGDIELTMPLVAASRLAPAGGVDIVLSLDVAPRSGLGTSGAVSVALARALTTLAGQPLLGVELAESAAAIERDSGIAGGKQDNYAAALGGVRALRTTDGSPWSTVTLGDRARTVIERCLVVHEGGGRDSQDLVRAVMAAYARAEKATCEALDGLASVGALLVAALSAGDTAATGALLDHVRALQETLHPAIARGIRASAVATIDPDLCWSKPVGGAGAGSAWLILPKLDREADLTAELLRRGFAPWTCAVADDGAQCCTTTALRLPHQEPPDVHSNLSPRPIALLPFDDGLGV